MTDNRFNRSFDSYACIGDRITADVGGFEVIATIHHDDSPDRPDENNDGFWPSRDPKAAGWIGNDPAVSFEDQQAHAEEVMRAWEADEWCYVGVVLSVKRNDVTLERNAAALWGVEMNYPGGDNSYLTEVANELLDEALEEARGTLAALCDCVTA